MTSERCFILPPERLRAGGCLKHLSEVMEDAEVELEKIGSGNWNRY
jgi:hypothetical protein